MNYIQEIIKQREERNRTDLDLQMHYILLEHIETCENPALCSVCGKLMNSETKLRLLKESLKEE